MISLVVTGDCRSSNLLLILYAHSMYKTFGQLIITCFFAVTLLLLHLYCGCMFYACGNQTVSEFSISLGCQIIAKWSSYFVSVTLGLFFITYCK